MAARAGHSAALLRGAQSAAGSLWCHALECVDVVVELMRLGGGRLVVVLLEVVVLFEVVVLVAFVQASAWVTAAAVAAMTVAAMVWFRCRLRLLMTNSLPAFRQRLARCMLHGVGGRPRRQWR